MEMLKQQEAKAVIAMQDKINQLQKQLQEANDRVRYLESQIYGGSQ